MKQTKRTRQTKQVAAWQVDPAQLTTDRVQCWTADGGMAGRLPLEQARELVANGRAIVVSDEAISMT